MAYSIAEIASLLGLPYQGDGRRVLTKVSNWDAADESSLIFLESKEKESRLQKLPAAGCIIAPPDSFQPTVNAIFSQRPKMDFARAAAFPQPAPLGHGI